MSIDIDHLRFAFYLTGEPCPPETELAELAELLDSREEVLPYLVLRRGAFSGSPRFLAAMKQAAHNAASPQTRRPASSHSRVVAESARRDMAAAVRALIDRDLEDRTALEEFEAAQRRFVEAGPAVGFDAPFRIRPVS